MSKISKISEKQLKNIVKQALHENRSNILEEDENEPLKGLSPKGPLDKFKFGNCDQSIINKANAYGFEPATTKMLCKDSGAFEPLQAGMGQGVRLLWTLISRMAKGVPAGYKAGTGSKAFQAAQRFYGQEGKFRNFWTIVDLAATGWGTLLYYENRTWENSEEHLKLKEDIRKMQIDRKDAIAEIYRLSKDSEKEQEFKKIISVHELIEKFEPENKAAELAGTNGVVGAKVVFNKAREFQILLDSYGTIRNEQQLNEVFKGSGTLEKFLDIFPLFKEDSKKGNSLDRYKTYIQDNYIKKNKEISHAAVIVGSFNNQALRSALLDSETAFEKVSLIDSDGDEGLVVEIYDKAVGNLPSQRDSAVETQMSKIFRINVGISQVRKQIETKLKASGMFNISALNELLALVFGEFAFSRFGKVYSRFWPRTQGLIASFAVFYNPENPLEAIKDSIEYFKSLSSTLESDYQNFKKISDFVNKQNDLGIETLDELNAAISKLEKTEEVFFKYYKDQLNFAESQSQNEELDQEKRAEYAGYVKFSKNKLNNFKTNDSLVTYNFKKDINNLKKLLSDTKNEKYKDLLSRVRQNLKMYDNSFNSFYIKDELFQNHLDNKLDAPLRKAISKLVNNNKLLPNFSKAKKGYQNFAKDYFKENKVINLNENVFDPTNITSDDWVNYRSASNTLRDIINNKLTDSTDLSKFGLIRSRLYNLKDDVNNNVPAFIKSNSKKISLAVRKSAFNNVASYVKIKMKNKKIKLDMVHLRNVILGSPGITASVGDFATLRFEKFFALAKSRGALSAGHLVLSNIYFGGKEEPLIFQSSNNFVAMGNNLIEALERGGIGATSYSPANFRVVNSLIGGLDKEMEFLDNLKDAVRTFEGKIKDSADPKNEGKNDFDMAFGVYYKLIKNLHSALYKYSAGASNETIHQIAFHSSNLRGFFS